MRSPFRVALLVLIAFCSACQGASGILNSLKELEEVQRQVAATTHFEDINVHLGNERYLTVSLINSPFKALPDEQKKTKAREIAVVAYSAFASRSQLASVTVVYLVHKSYFFVFNYSDGTDAQTFPASELTGGSTQPTPEAK